MMRRATTVVAAAASLTLAVSAAAHAYQDDPAPRCEPAGKLASIPELFEASGIAVSRRTPGRLWAHNDSGDAVLFALSPDGAVAGRVRVTGAGVEDWEALAVAPCPAGSCLYIGDIGDNDAERRRITVYRVPEPAPGEQTAAAKDAFHATYPDGAHDAEALLVTPEGAIFIVTKGETGPVALYRFPRLMHPGETHVLERIGTPRAGDRVRQGERVTDGAVSPDGVWAVLRTNRSLSLYRAADLLGGDWREVRRLDLTDLDEPQGEGVALASDGSIYLAGEGGGKKRPGTLGRLACAGLAAR